MATGLPSKKAQGAEDNHLQTESCPVCGIDRQATRDLIAALTHALDVIKRDPSLDPEIQAAIGTLLHLADSVKL
jgi:hypothetical protein